MAQLIVRNLELFLSVMTLGEIRKGIDRLKARDVPESLMLDRGLDEIRSSFSDNLLDVTAEISKCWGHLQALRPLPAVDALIAAAVIRYDLVLVTRNEADFEGLGIKIINPFPG